MAEEVAIKKRQAISQAGRNMFIAVAAASVLVGFAAVGSVFLIQKLMFNAKVIGAKQETAKILTENNKTIVELEKSIKAMESNKALRKVMIGSDGNTLRVVPDALPSFNNPTALGASIMDRLLEPVISVETFAFDGEGNVTDEESPEPSAGQLEPIGFSFSIKGTPEEISKALQNLEHSIRQIDILTMTLSYRQEVDGGAVLELTATARAYFTSPVSIALGEKEIKSNENASKDKDAKEAEKK